jgi:hypothetical protein
MAPDPLLVRRALRRLAREFPNIVEISAFPELDTADGHRALFYLADKKFVESGAISNRLGQPREMLQAKITASGLDWLHGEESTSSALGDTTSPFELEALRHFLKQSLETSDIPAQKKQVAIARLLAFSSADVKALVLRLLQATADRPDVLVELISKTGK